MLKYTKFGMCNLALEFIYMTAITLFFGFVLGAVCVFIYTKVEIKSLEKEVDKFRDLYFEEMDKWKNNV